MENFVTLSIETHLFFARIMKEHALFLEAGFPCKNKEWIAKADDLREKFEDFHREVVRIANGRVNSCILESDELVTQFTIPAEKQTSALSGIPIDSQISMAQQRLQSDCRISAGMNGSRELSRAVWQLNERSLCLLNRLISFKENILSEVENGRLFTANYPLLIKHILREAKLYRSSVEELMHNRRPSYKNLRQTEDFWNQIMMEHALFIRGLLDPCEEELIDTADNFAEEYKALLHMACEQDCRANTMPADKALTEKSLAETLRYRDFKTAGAEGILNRQIASIILPLLADHVLREANHYIRLLECGRTV